VYTHYHIIRKNKFESKNRNTEHEQQMCEEEMLNQYRSKKKKKLDFYKNNKQKLKNQNQNFIVSAHFH